MTVRVVTGDLFADDAQCLVNAVNTVGVMGAGVAKQFAKRWPGMLDDYRRACRTGLCAIGHVYFWRNWGGLTPGPDWIANLPTKDHWRDPSQYSYVSHGLTSLVAGVSRREITSVAMPALGCGLGGLDFEQVLRQIEAAFVHSPDIDVRVYRPAEGGRR